MIITFTSYRLECRQWSDKAQLNQYLAGRCGKYHVLGEKIDSPNEFFSVIIQPIESPSGTIGIGIYSIGIGLQPDVYLRVETGIAMIGFNADVCGVNLLNNTLIFWHELNSPFYYFAFISTPPRILVQHEIGIVMLTEEGKILWKFDGDIITDLQCQHDRIEINFMDAPPVSLSLASGIRLE